MKLDQDFPDDFQFKPLTEGLGFHPKKQEEVVRKVSTPILEPKIKASLLETPLPRPKTNPKSIQPSAQQQTVDGLLKSLQDKNKSLKFQDKSKTQSPYVHAFPNLSAGLLDWLLITSISLLYLMLVTLTLKMDLIKLLSQGGSGVIASTAGIFLAVGFIYYVSQRIFIGYTLGEWAYEQRLGLPEEFKNGYSFKVLLRQLLLFATGVIVLPLLSWAFQHDIAGISGLSVYRRR